MMQLSSPDTIAKLLASNAQENRPKRRRRRADAVRPEEQARVARSTRRCQCGRCLQCLDNLRWERIFNEKFADPTYYGPLVMRGSSPLA